MDQTDELFVKILNLWFNENPAEYKLTDNTRSFALELIRRTQYGDDAVFSHDKIDEIIYLLKDYGVFDYEKSKMDLYFEGRMRYQLELREYANSPEVRKTLKAFSNVLEKMFKSIMKEAEKQIEEERNLSAIPHLASLPMYEN